MDSHIVHESCLYDYCLSLPDIIRQQTIAQGSFCVWGLPMRDDVTMQRRLPLAGRIHRMIPDSVINKEPDKVDVHCFGQ